MARKKGATQNSVEQRRYDLGEIIAAYKEKRKPFTHQKLLKDLRTQGYLLDLRTMQRDLVVIARSNTFLRDIAESTYSQYVEECFEDLEEMRYMIKQWLENPPQISRQKMQPGRLPSKKMRITETIVETVSQISLVRLLAEVTSIKLSILNGNIINTSVELLSNKLQKVTWEMKNRQQPTGGTDNAHTR